MCNGKLQWGIIIWGAPDGVVPAGQKEKIFQGALTPIDNAIEKDNLVSRITSNLIPGLSDFKCQILSHAGNKVAIIEIQQSEYSPHQADGKYYMRLDGQSVPAPHHFIEAKFKQIKYPNLESHLKVFNVTRSPNNVNYTVSMGIAIFNWSPLQNEENVSLRVLLNPALFHGHVANPGIYRRPNDLILNNVAPLLVYAQPVIHRETLIVAIEDLHRLNDGVISIEVRFHGKSSPSKVCKYSIRIIRNSDPLTWEFVEKNENKLAIDTLAETMTKEQIIATLFE